MMDEWFQVYTKSEQFLAIMMGRVEVRQWGRLY
jgi:hypothetical protein